jgi:two-component system, NtrC family, response regulator AtoC
MDEKHIPNDPDARTDPATTTIRSAPGRASDQRFLLVLQDGHFVTQPLPDSGDVIIGRSERCDVRITDPSISRQHALLRMGKAITVEDLGSSNGTIVREAQIPSKVPTEVATNEVFLLGAVTVVVQHRPGPVRSRRLWSHDYFEGRVGEECARAERNGGTFSVVRLRFGRAVTPHELQEPFNDVLREVDVIGLYGPSEYELLLIDAAGRDAELVVSRLQSILENSGVAVGIGVASFPKDGRDADKLIARASKSARSGPEPETRGRKAVVLRDEAMRNLYRLAERVAAGSINVLILGETGVGKQVLAEFIHKSSPRRDKPFLELNCSAFTETLLESELFGHEKGSFTGAVQSKAGLLETAKGGTVFLDEIGDMALALQAKLLRVIENQEVLRVGGLKPRAIDVRFVAATNRDLEQEVLRGTFRQDLYFRINGVSLQVPPLRQRVGEIEDLANAFIDDFCREAGRRTRLELTGDALELLCGYSWPGNIRELRNVIERATLLSTGDAITPEHLPVEKMNATFATPVKGKAVGWPLPSSANIDPGAMFSGQGSNPALAEFQSDEKTGELPRLRGDETVDQKKQRIMQALMDCGGNNTEAAKLLGVSRRTLGKWLEAYGIPRPRKKNKS